MPLKGGAPQFHRLRVQEVRQEAEDAVSITFDIPANLAPSFRFEAGQYLTLRATIEGESVRRSYSICSGAEDGELRIAIKRVDDGLFSRWAFEALRPGTPIDVMSPTGRFGIPGPLADGRIHLGIAAGSGITPVLSIVRTVLAREPHSHVFLLYGSRSTAAILFRGALEDLKDRYMGRLSVFHVLSQERQDVTVQNGRLDREKLTLLLRQVLGGAAVDAAYVCGPLGMIETAEQALADAGVAADRVHIERFTSALTGQPRARPSLAPEALIRPYATAAVIVDGARVPVPIAQGETVLDAAQRAGLDLPFACRGGMCSTCRAKLVEGEAEMLLNYSLEPWETKAGFVLTCQTVPKSSHIVIDYDQQ